jgi:hypothetical protein
MAISRKEFLQRTIRGIFVLGVGQSLQAYASSDFRLPCASEMGLRFVMVSDGHYGQADTNYDIHHDNMVSWLNMEKKQRGLDFVMVNGDLFHNDISYLPLVKKKWDGLDAPYYVSHGNHDLADETAWKNIWKRPWNFSYELEDAAFLVLNTSDEKGNHVCPDLEWTKGELTRLQSKKHLFVFMHITPFTWTRGGVDCPELVALFNTQPNLKLVFNGHDHDQDHVKESAGRFYFFDSHIAGNWGTDYRGYRIVELLKNGEILTYQVNPTLDNKINENKIRV